MRPSPGVQLLLGIAAGEAASSKAPELESDHVFLALLIIGELLNTGGKSLPISESEWDRARPDIASLKEHLSEHQVKWKWMHGRLGKLLSERDTETGEFGGLPSDSCRDLLERATTFAVERGDECFNVLDVLASVLDEPSELLREVLKQFGVDVEKLRPDVTGESGNKTESVGAPDRKVSPLARFGRDLTALAREGNLGPVIGRRETCKEIARILLQRRVPNPLLVGEPGVGKTAVVEALALYAADEDTQEDVSDLHFVEVSPGALVAGTAYRGQFEERLKKLMDAAKKDSKLVFFIDEMHTLLGAGSASGASLDAANILKPALESGDVRVIGATTTDECHKYVDTDKALRSRFQTVWINEPTPSDTLEILRGVGPKLEEHHHLSIADEALQKAVDLSGRYMTEDHQPRKALAVIDQACARCRLQSFTRKPGDGGEVVQVEDVGAVVAQRTGVPIEVLLMEDEKRLLGLETALEMRVLGQADALQKVGRTVRRSRAGLAHPDKPNVLLFAGPSGTGKTELAKALAEYLFHDQSRLITLDMTEYQDRTDVYKIKGSDPGFVGYGDEGILVREIKKHPYSVVLLDEIEKAHRDVITFFMPIFDEGRMTTAEGRKINFSEAIFVLTSNLGGGPAGPGVGFDIGEQLDDAKKKERDAKALEDHVMAAIRSHLLPELLNRVQDIAVFKPLSKEVLYRIIDLYLAAANRRLQPRQVRLTIDDPAKELLVELGYSPEYGARHLQRSFDREVGDPLSDLLVAGDVQPGETVHGRRKDGHVKLKVRRAGGVETVPVVDAAVDPAGAGG